MAEATFDTNERGRIAYLDGMRCFSIMAVLCFHYFNGWAMPQLGICPYGELLSRPFQYGYLGVEMFFMISGLVIMMTLTRCNTWREFALRRAARIVPAMILFSLLTFAVVAIFAPNVFQVSAWGFVPSWLFITPGFLNGVFETTVFNSIDSVYWSLYAEVKFYLVVGMLYFLSGKHFYRNALTFFALSFAAADMASFMEWQKAYDVIGFVSAPKYFPWFMIGIGFYLLTKGAERGYSAAFITLGIAQLYILAALEPSTVRFVIPVLLPLMFFAALKMEILQRFFAWRPLVAIGMASYGLYLVHQNVGLVLIENLGRALRLTGWPSVSVAVVVAAAMIGLCLFVFRYVECPLNRWAVKRWAGAR